MAGLVPGCWPIFFPFLVANYSNPPPQTLTFNLTYTGGFHLALDMGLPFGLPATVDVTVALIRGQVRVCVRSIGLISNAQMLAAVSCHRPPLFGVRFSVHGIAQWRRASALEQYYGFGTNRTPRHRSG
jgi:hypothetical protein